MRLMIDDILKVITQDHRLEGYCQCIRARHKHLAPIDKANEHTLTRGGKIFPEISVGPLVHIICARCPDR